ncbi:MAG: DEAD/DEAH box helicase family protein, partial [Moorea sp. SIO4E2]|uniref:DEAD/DEAH box helicase n=1 Tax=Moorena sp. SIO4E2 TaxID=2607826 RepID=UPI0013BE00B9
MIDFKKKLGLKSIEKKVNPIEIYDSLDRRSETGPLRPIQKEVLEEWWANRREEKDIILKLHTGQGKTLIGLLILQSRLNEKKGPCLYVCPNKYLVQQTCQQAERFGIGYSVIGKDNSLPDEFVNSEHILITHVQKVFNGKSIFGFGGKCTKVNTIVLDDSHACIDSISESFKIKVDQDHDLYQKLIQLFENDLKEQGEGSFLEIKDGYYHTFLPVPYWSWQNKKSEVLEIISEYRDYYEIMFTWPVIKDNIENCQCFFSGQELEISTFINPIDDFGTFSKAEHRLFMSATSQNDSSFIKVLGLSASAVKKPLTAKNEKWSGEKMILIPSMIHEELDRDSIIHKFAELAPKLKPAGIVFITSSFKKAKLYEKLNYTVVDSKSIFEEVNQLKSGNTNQGIVIVNRYDGVDLPDDACRILILDSCPFAESLTERYEEYCRYSSEIISIKIAQKIEQGLGRSVRGEKDYSVILIIGDDLVKFVKNDSYKKYFSDQTRKQIEIGFEIVKYSIEDDIIEGEDPFISVRKLVNQCLTRNEGWKEFYKEKMDSIEDNDGSNISIADVLELERKAEEKLLINDPENAIYYIQKIIDKYYGKDSEERGWYLQTLARYKYRISKSDSIKIQGSAFKCNKQLLKPQKGIIYKKLNFINENRLRRIKDWVSSHGNYEQMMIELTSITDN